MNIPRLTALLLAGALAAGLTAGCGTQKEHAEESGKTYFDRQNGCYGYYYKNANGWDFRGFSASAGTYTSLDGSAKAGIRSYAVLPEISGEPVSSIDFSAFSGCAALTEVTIPDSVTAIQWKAFSGCTSLADVTLPEGLTSIGNDAFWGCDAMTSITVPESVTAIGSKAIGFGSDGRVTEGFVLFGTSGSAAETYAQDYRITFREAGSASMPIAPASGLFGDVNGDGAVNASDAALVTISAANAGAGGAASVSPEVGDINGDGAVNASDAAMILVYAAAAGGGFEGTLEEFLQRRNN